jgi:hypothetical protein
MLNQIDGEATKAQGGDDFARDRKLALYTQNDRESERMASSAFIAIRIVIEP